MKKRISIALLLLLLASLSLLASCLADGACAHETVISTVVEAGCESEGYTLHKCQGCGREYKTNHIPSKGHTLTEQTVAATCTSEGYSLYACACGYSYQGEFMPPRGHSFAERVVAPTCTEEGYTEYTCTCTYSYRADYKKPSGHTPTSTVVSPTCTEQGYTKYTCACGYSYFGDYQKPAGHTLTETVVVPTCTEQGYTQYACTCGYSYFSDYKKPAGHALTETVVDPTCTEQGYTQYACTCGYSYRSDYVEPTGHTFTSVLTRPTSSENGKNVLTCACSYTYTVPVLSSEVFGAYVSTTEALAYGVDVSYHEDVDWEVLREAGVEFVILRAGYTGTKDTKFEEYYAAAVAAGFGVGCYYYLDITLEELPTMSAEDFRALALRNAEEFLTWISGKTFDYPVYLDMEDPSLVGKNASGVQVYEPTDRQILTDMCHLFIRRVQEEGWYCGLYVNRNWLTNYLIAEDLTPYYDIWYARYPYAQDWNFEEGLPSWLDDEDVRTGMWQYTENGVIGTHFAGQNKVDLNVAFKNYPALIRLLGYNGYSTSAVL